MARTPPPPRVIAVGVHLHEWQPGGCFMNRRGGGGGMYLHRRTNLAKNVGIPLVLDTLFMLYKLY